MADKKFALEDLGIQDPRKPYSKEDLTAVKNTVVNLGLAAAGTASIGVSGVAKLARATYTGSRAVASNSGIAVKGAIAAIKAEKERKKKEKERKTALST